jgi:imidazole glycerol phosphate synthase glutamine amidotransferase subunit
MKNQRVLVVPTGTANMASVLSGLRRAGANAEITRDPNRILSCSRLVLPGVGALGAAMQRLSRDGLVEALAARVKAGKPTLAVCLGLQLLCNGSEENPGQRGLAVVPEVATKFPRTVRVPQIGWNLVEPDDGCRLIERGYAYFANSYRLIDPPADWNAALSDHGGRYVAALERGSVLACQFHPELSSGWGLALIRRWMDMTGGASC